MLEVVVAISMCSAGDQVLTGLPASFDEGLHLLFAETTHTLPLGSLPLRIHCPVVFDLLCWLMCLKIYRGIQNCCYRTRKHFLFVSSLTWLLTHLHSIFQKVVVHHPSYPGVKWSESRSDVSDSLRLHRLYSPWNSPGQNNGVVTFPFPRGSSQPRDRTQVSRIAGGFFTSWAIREALECCSAWDLKELDMT